MNKKEFQKRIKTQGWNREEDGESEWYTSSTEKSFLDAGKKLLDKGFTPEEALDLLEDLSSAMSEEYGDG